MEILIQRYGKIHMPIGTRQFVDQVSMLFLLWGQRIVGFRSVVSDFLGKSGILLIRVAISVTLLLLFPSFWQFLACLG